MITGIDDKEQRPFLQIIDYGQGIAIDSQDKIFEPFYTTESTGSGLGLYLCKELSEANQAQLSYHFTEANNNSCFTLTLSHPQRKNRTTMSHSVLIIDDEPDIRGLLSITVERMGYKSNCVANVSSAMAALDSNNYDLCLSDLKLPDGSGIDIVKHLESQQPATPVIVITAHGSMDIAITAMKHGAFDFINKPVDLSHLRTLITNALQVDKGETDLESVPDIIGNSPLTTKLKENIVKVARSQAPIFIRGESGSGKELVARAIHKLSSRKDKPFVGINCGAIPRELMESEFFGHTKGSFTGAHQDKEGLFQSAAGGTLFLDEVADLPIDMQVKLLRTIQEKTIRPVGSQKEVPVDVRILSATHKDLSQAIQEGSFRNDLYYRINVIEINVAPLRKRIDDIPLLISALLKKIAAKNNTRPVDINKDAIASLQTYDFPGNVRELENILERACALCAADSITTGDLELHSSPHFAEADSIDKTISASADPISYDPTLMSIDEYLDGLEREIILKYLEQQRWNRTSTAKALGITFRSLRYRLKKLGIDDGE